MKANGSGRKVVLVERLSGGDDGGMQAAEDPLVPAVGVAWVGEVGNDAFHRRRVSVAFEVGKCKLGGVPQFVAEVAIGDDTVGVEVDVTTLTATKETQDTNSAKGAHAMSAQWSSEQKDHHFASSR